MHYNPLNSNSIANYRIVIANSRQGESEPVSNDLFDDVDQDMFVDATQEATKDVQDQIDFSDNEDMTDELQEMEEVLGLVPVILLLVRQLLTKIYIS
jgi:hypothetical protein